MNRVKIFLEFVEIRTKVASVFPMLIGFLWAIKLYGSLHIGNTLLFVGAVLLFDMCTTAINNTMDYVKAVDLNYQSQENVLGIYGLSYAKMLRVIAGLLGTSIVLSLLLVWQTNIVLLALGVVCFAIGIGYTYGPMPLSRLPLGELFSGGTMGFGIVYLAIFTSHWQQLVFAEFVADYLVVRLYWLALFKIIWFSLPLVALIANIMLANNTCDLQTDIQNHRYTLVYYIGVKHALRLYQLLAILPWIIWASYIVAGYLPIGALLGYILLIPYWRMVQRFINKQVKRETFIESVKSFVLFSTMYAIVLAISCIV